MSDFPNQYLKEGKGLYCRICDEYSAVPDLPMPLDDFIAQLEAFSKLHEAKGCNTNREPIPNWPNGDQQKSKFQQRLEEEMNKKK